MNKRNLFLMAGGCCLAALTSCQAVYEDLDECPQYLNVQLTAVEEGACASVEGDRYTYNPDAFKQIAVGIYDAQTATLVRYLTKDVNSAKDADITFKNLPQGKYIITAWAAEKSSPEIYNTKADAFPWKTDVKAIEENKGDLPLLFYGSSRTYEAVIRPDAGTMTDTVTVNLQPYVQQFRFKLNHLEVGKNYRLSLIADAPQYDFKNGHLERPTLYTNTFVARNEAETIEMSMLKPYDVMKAVIRVEDAETNTLYFKKSFEQIVSDIETLSGKALNLQCLERVPVELDINKTYMSVSVRILNWGVNYRVVEFTGYPY